MFIGLSAGLKTIDDDELGVGESGRADKAVADAFPDKAGEAVFIQSQSVNATDPTFRAAVADVEGRLAGRCPVGRAAPPA